MTDATELRVERLIAEVQNLTATVQQLVDTTPQRTKTWIEPSELAKLLGVSSRTIARYRTQGAFREGSLRKRNKQAYQYHSIYALADAQLVVEKAQ